MGLSLPVEQEIRGVIQMAIVNPLRMPIQFVPALADRVPSASAG
jgi:hypothetical protein